jgi:CRP-like cAMP-binding protein
MKYDYLENGAVYYGIGDHMKCFSIIQDGTIELQTVMDNGTPVVLERLTRGAILGAYTMLIEDDLKVSAVCTSPVVIFTIARKRFTEIILHDHEMIVTLLKVVDELIESVN